MADDELSSSDSQVDVLGVFDSPNMLVISESSPDSLEGPLDVLVAGTIDSPDAVEKDALIGGGDSMLVISESSLGVALNMLVGVVMFGRSVRDNTIGTKAIINGELPDVVGQVTILGENS